MNFFFTILIFTCFFTPFTQAQLYTSYFTGDTTDVSPQPESGVCLMGGATENDNAMRWFLKKAKGGDVVVIRVTGSDGYNDYMFSELGITVNSVESILIPSVAAANSPYVRRQLLNAEAIWIAGGDQGSYTSFWKNTAVDSALNNLINIKKGVVGGTSAGMAIMGQAYFNALNGTVTSAVALSSPYHPKVSIGYNDFLFNPKMDGVITDTHFDSPDRSGRMVTFLARCVTDYGKAFMGIACDEYCAVCIGDDLKAYVYGKYPQNDDNVYFIQPDTCTAPYGPETCVAGTPLTWNRNNAALRVYRLKAENTGSKYFDLNTKNTGEGGEWLNWHVNNGVLQQTTSATAPCITIGITNDAAPEPSFAVYPNPATDLLMVESFSDGFLQITDTKDSVVLRQIMVKGVNQITIKALLPGMYFVSDGHEVVRFSKK
jgi:cyanophycinase-like exopeptidase